VLVVQVSALVAVLQDGTAKSVGVAVPDVPLPLTVFVAIVARLAFGRFPVTPVVSGRPVKLVAVPDAGVPKAPPTKYAAPVPTSSVRAARRLALLGVARNVETPAASPLIPVATGRPVALVSVPDAGVPRTGAVNVCCPAQLWAVENTSALSIDEVTLVAPIAVTPPAEIVTSPLIVWQIGSAAAWPTASWAEVQRSEENPVVPGPLPIANE
jgi:hypothetical protein